MATIWQDSFEIQFAENDPGLWTSFTEGGATQGELTYVAANARTGGGAVRIRSTTEAYERYLSETLPSTYTELFFQVPLLWDSGTPLVEGHGGIGVAFLVLLSSDTSKQITLTLDGPTNLIRVYRGSAHTGTLLGTGSVAIGADQMYCVELRVVIHDSAGVITTRVNGAVDINLTGIDTNVSGDNIQAFQMGVAHNGDGGGPGGEADFYFDDVIVNDTTGTVSNSWPNGAGVHMFTPNADGTYTAMTSTGGAVDYTEVDDVASYGSLPDGDITMLSSSTTGQRTSVNLTNTAVTGTVGAVMLVSNVANSAAGADNMAHFVRVNSTDYDQTSFVPSTSYAWRTDVLTLSPDTSAAWSTAELDALELGWKRVT